jgi:phosphoenolpyruvate synthase/pyruvate phosphate dikinase
MPEPRTHTRPLHELRRSDAAEYGGKSANLGELLAGGLDVPAGFAVAADAFRAFLATTGLDGTIATAMARAASGNVDDGAAASKAIGEAMRFAPLPDELRDELAERHHELVRAHGGEEPPIAVRSSAIGEDSEDATFAGQQESFLWLRGLEQLCDAVRDCWASLYTARAIGYRAALGMGGEEPAMGVTVQVMVDAEVSGVLFTCNPVSGDPSVVAVDASWGLGTAVVSGEITPDHYLVSKVTGELVRRTVHPKPVEHVPHASGGGTVRREVPRERRDVPCLDDDALAALVGVAQNVERHFGSHQDVEWALARGRVEPGGVHVLQARPVTGLPEKVPKPTGSALALVLSTFGARPEQSGRS